jgi:hypothetical protein
MERVEVSFHDCISQSADRCYLADTCDCVDTARSSVAFQRASEVAYPTLFQLVPDMRIPSRSWQGACNL